MRLARLDLIRYGHFTNLSVDLPAGNSDFHIIFGPNEAGKSTALAAIEDLLFGIPTRSSFGFLHDYTTMRIGAVLESAQESLEVVRRKGNKETLLDPDGSPLRGGEGVLRPYLGGVDGAFFGRMFSLDHVRLEKGGRDILESKDDVGHILFSAGAGILGLRECFDQLSSEANDLWSPKRAKHRKFYIAADKLDESRKRLREQTLTAGKWQEIKRTHEIAEREYADLDQMIQVCTTERNRLSRIRRVLPEIRRKQELDGQIDALGSVIDLPISAAKEIDETQHKSVEVTANLNTFEKQLKNARDGLKGLVFDELLVQRTDDVRQVHERRIEIRGEKADLPKREAELKAAEEELRVYAGELGWTQSDATALAKLLPTVSKVGVLRDLLNQKGKLEVKVTDSESLFAESRDEYEKLNERLVENGDPTDVSRLAISIKTVKERGDLTGRVENAKKALTDKQRSVDRRLEALRPKITDEKILADLCVPARGEIEEFRIREDDCKRRLRETKHGSLTAQEELDVTGSKLEHTARNIQNVTFEQLRDARGHRDSLWKLVKTRHIGDNSIPESQIKQFEEDLKDLTGAFESAMSETDKLADWRFDHAEEVGRIAEIKRKIGELKIQLRLLHEKENRTIEENEQLEVEWKEMWNAAPFTVRSVAAMLEWLDARQKVLQASEERDEAKNNLQSAHSENDAAKQRILRDMDAIGVDITALENETLDVVIEYARQEQLRQETIASRKAELEASVLDASNDVKRRKRQLNHAKENMNRWMEKWTDALDEIGLAGDTLPEAVGSQIETIDQMRATANRIRSLRHERIEKIKRDIVDFERVVEELVNELAEDLSGSTSEEAVLQLEKRLDKAEQLQARREEKTKEIENLTKQIDELKKEKQELDDSISHLMKTANVATKEELENAVKKSDLKRSLNQERQKAIEIIRHNGDGKSLEELEIECENTSVDQAAAAEESIEKELEDLQKQQITVIETRSQARDAFQEIGGDDAAAQAAANKEEAITEIRQVAERYIRVKASAMLLRCAIERYRRDKQAPLLKRTSKMFNVITGGSFTSLRVDYDDQDNAFLTGIRPNGDSVPVSGMSTGTSDQLYLALRLGAIEDYLQQSHALPFVADDLFINFDNDRAAASFRLLDNLSQKTQVLFFTHHQHLVEIAKHAFGDSVNLVNLHDR